ncbi:hypothetical protein Droror1_Dr00003368 [Drosera rotundifolia]
MASSQDADDLADHDECTVAFASASRRKSRRVSFAETTEVHLFERDDDYGTPRDRNDRVAAAAEETESVDGGSGVVEEEGEEEEGVGVGMRRSFFRPVESPSPGSTVGSVTDNDEDMFFGPVSADFIRPGRLSGSAVSNDNHDLTMDSAAFSMHFRSLASMEFGGELKTPKGISLVFDEKTPNQNVTTRTPGNSMVLTGSEKKKFVDSSSHINGTSDGGRSNDMTIEAEKPRTYDYGRLSPELEALLAQGEDVRVGSICNEADGLPLTTDAVTKEKMISEVHPSGHEFHSLMESSDAQVAHLESTDHISIEGAYNVVHSPVIEKRTTELSDSAPGSATHIVKAPDSSQVVIDVRCPATASFYGESSSCSSVSEPCPVTSSSTSGPNSTPVSPGGSCQSPADHDVSYVSNVQDQNHPDDHVLYSEERTSEVVGINVDDNAARDKCANILGANEDIENVRNIQVVANIMKDGGMPDESMSNQFSLETSASFPSFQMTSTTVRDLEKMCVKENLLPSERAISLPVVSHGKELNAGTGAIDSAFSPAGNSTIPEIHPRQELRHRKDKEQCDLKHENLLIHETNVTTLQFGQLKQNRDSYAFHGDNNVSFKPFDFNSNSDSSNLKRKLGELVHELEGHASKGKLLQRDPKFQRSQNCFSGSKIESHRQPSEALTSLREVSEHLLPECFNVLDLGTIGKLEILLVQLQKAQSHDILCSHINSQRVSNDICSQGKREAETKMLLLKTLYAKARSQLLSLRRKTLLSKVYSLRSGIKESEKLKSRSQQDLFVTKQFHSQVDDRCSETCPKEVDMKSVGTMDKVPILRQALEVSEQKIKTLTESFYDNLKRIGDENSFEAVALFKNNFKKRLTCHLLASELQPWKIERFESDNGEHIAVLVYGSFLVQRFKVKIGPTYGLTVSSTLDETRIMKTFPNLDALAAFTFVLSGKIHIKNAGLRTFAQVTQKTSSILHNLLDVLKEVATARVELTSLTHANFFSPSVDQLGLHLFFVNLNSGGKVSASLDVSCLKYGVYPSEALPYETKDGAAHGPKSSSTLLPNNIRSATGCLKGGYMRILRLCRCIAKVVQDSNSDSQ